jgi:hypothetical protein
MLALNMEMEPNIELRAVEFMYISKWKDGLND